MGKNEPSYGYDGVLEDLKILLNYEMDELTHIPVDYNKKKEIFITKQSQK